MNKKLMKLIGSTVLATTLFSLTGCSEAVKGKTLAKAATPTELSYSERQSGEFLAFLEKCNDFSATFATEAFSDYTKADNFAVSPVSVFMSLAMAAECSNGNTREEILDALGVTQSELSANVGTLHRALNKTHKYVIEEKEKTLGRVDFDNSIWLDNGLNAYMPTLNTLASDYYCNSFEVDFDGKNSEANEAIRNYVKEKTKGLIDRDFALSKETVFALVNALYLKDVWNTNGNDLKRTDKTYEFVGANGAKASKRFLQGYYLSGRTYETEDYSAFFTMTNHGYTIKFILPAEGMSVQDVFNAETLEAVSKLAYWKSEETVDGVKTKYYTRCIFPEFSASYLNDVRKYLERMGITDLFSPTTCDFSALTDTEAYCAKITHATELKVDRKGIEGAAVTVMGGNTTGAPDEVVKIYEDFLVDRSFGFILTDRYGLTLFSGVVDRI